MSARGAGPADPAAPALVCLVALAALSPWALGGAPPLALRAISAVALATAALVLARGAHGGGAALPAVPLWPLGAFLALALGQLVPLPGAVHAVLAPGSHAVWHPANPAAAAVLGSSPRPVSLDPRATLSSAALVAGLGLLAVLSSPLLAARDRVAARAAGALAAAGFALAAYAIFARARFGALLYGSIPVPTISPFGPFVNKNHFAGWAAMAFAIVAGLAVGLAGASGGRGARDWTAGRRAAGVVLAVVAALALALAVLVSLSRGGAVALVAGGLALAALVAPRAGGSRPARVLAPAALVAIVLAAAALATTPEASRERLRTFTGASFRIGTWQDALRLSASSPAVGSGLGAFHDAYPRWKRGYGDVRVEHAESEPLETLAETGAAGLALALAGLLTLLRGVFRRGGRGVAWAVGCGGGAAVVAVAVHGLVDFDLRVPSNAALAALAASAAAGLAGVRGRPLPRPACAALSLLALLLLAASTAAPPTPALAARDELQRARSAPTEAVRRLRLARAAAAAAEAVSRRPAHAESWLALAYARAGLGDPAAAALARHAETLDPRRPGVHAAVLALSADVLSADAP